MAVQKRPTELVDMAKLMSFQGADPLVLTQLSGPGRPRKIRILPLEEAVFGRDDDCQVILDEDPVSRRHARILFADSKPQILDLGSTNGTFVNGKQVHRALLKNGDRIQIGGSAFQVGMSKEGAPREPLSGAGIQQVRSLIQKGRGESPADSGQSSAFSGNLVEIRLPSLLQVLESDRTTGTLVIRTAGREGKLHIHQGAIRHATLGRARGVKALYRLMVFEEGRFEFYIPGRSPEYDTVEGDLQKHLLEAMRQKDELGAYRKQLPQGEVALSFKPGVNINPARVPGMVYEVMAAIRNYRTVDRILEFCQVPDFEICRVLVVLLKHDVVTVEPAAN